MNKKTVTGSVLFCGFVFLSSITYGNKPDSVWFNDKVRLSDKFAKKANGGSVFIGQSLLLGNISGYFTNPCFIGASGEIYRRRFIFHIDSYIGYCKTRDTLIFQGNTTWEPHKAAYNFLVGLNAGYLAFEKKNLVIVPVGGLGIKLLSPTFFNQYGNALKEPILFYYKLGFFIDFKPVVLIKSDIYKEGDYTGVRLSFGVNSPIGKSKYPDYYHGTVIYLSLGFSWFQRER